MGPETPPPSKIPLGHETPDPTLQKDPLGPETADPHFSNKAPGTSDLGLQLDTFRTREWRWHTCPIRVPRTRTELQAIVHPFPAGVPPRTRFIAPMSPRGPNGSPQSPKMAFYWVKVGPKCSQSGSTLLKTVQNGSNTVKIGPQAARWVPRWY